MRVARVDANQAEIVDLFRRCGWSVHCTHTVGNGFPDLVVGKHGLNILLEIKNPAQSKRDQRLTKAEAEFHETWRGRVFVVQSASEALRACEEIVNGWK